MIYLEYLLEASSGGMRCPSWVDDGGYWGGTDHTLIGATRSNPEFHIPSTVNRLSAAQLETRQVAIHNANAMTKEGAEPGDDEVEMTEAEVRAAIQAWVAARS